VLEKTIPILPISLIVVSDYLTADGDEELRRALRAYAQDARGVLARSSSCCRADIRLKSKPISPARLHSHHRR
jgi:hypothetical protein